MAGRAEMSMRSRKSEAAPDLRPAVGAPTEHLAAPVAADILGEIRAPQSAMGNGDANG